MKKNIPQTLKGFRDFFGAEARIRQQVIAVFKNTFEKYGYEPLETPALEYAEVLLGKSGEEMDKLAYIFNDPGKRRVGLKYDLTVPACRFIAQNYQQLTFPLKRYQIQLAWRAEKPQKGRFREFIQCDADVWGTKSVLVDAEFMQMGIEILEKLGFKDFIVRINNRKIINGLFAFCGAPENQFYDLAIAIDKLAKIGLEGVAQELAKRKITSPVANKVLSVIGIKGSDQEKFAILRKKLNKNQEALEGIAELEKIFAFLKAVGVKSQYCCFEPAIIRGMAYYTGPVWEFEILEGGVGSVAGAGRYDRLTGLYCGQDIPASGGSFGLERIVEVMKNRRLVQLNQALAEVLVTIFSPDLWPQSAQLAKDLRNSGIACELYLDPQIKLEKQLKYADKKGIPWVIILGPDEIKNQTATLKNLKNGQQKTLPQSKLLEEIKKK